MSQNWLKDMLNALPLWIFSHVNCLIIEETAGIYTVYIFISITNRELAEHEAARMGPGIFLWVRHREFDTLVDLRPEYRPAGEKNGKHHGTQ